MRVTNKEFLSVASAGGYAVGAFNINNMEILQVIIETVTMCINDGFTSIMIDGSHLNFEENIAMTMHVVGLACSKGVSVEAELGKLVSQESTAKDAEDPYTDPDSAVEFVARIGVDSLAFAIDTSHGAHNFKGDVKLDFERLKAIRNKVDVPLVLHGASGVPSWIVEKATKYGTELSGAKGIPDEHIKKAISLGIEKININTDLRLAFTSSVREVLVSSPKEYDPLKFLGPAKENMKKVVQEKMRLLGSSGKAVQKEDNP